jgi:hypothetical protein
VRSIAVSDISTRRPTTATDFPSIGSELRCAISRDDYTLSTKVGRLLLPDAARGT